MVTCKVDSAPVSKMNSTTCAHKPSGSQSSGFRLLDSDQLETSSSVSRNSVYKLKIDLMFDDNSRSMRSHQLDDPRGSRRTRSIIMYGRSELASTAGESSRTVASILQETTALRKPNTPDTKKDVQRMSNSVQAQIEQLFTDVAKDTTNSFAVTCLGCLPLNDKITSLQGLQAPLRELYFTNGFKETCVNGTLEIGASGLRIKTNNGRQSDCEEEQLTPFHNIAVWSAVKLVISKEDGGAAFLPLITSPDNIDKAALFQPLNSREEEIATENSLTPLFAVVMRSSHSPKVLLECHAFICKSTEDAIVIAATLYQSLMAHVNSNSNRSNKRMTPRNRNGVSCMSIASSSAVTGSNYLTQSQAKSSARKNSFHSSSGTINEDVLPQRSVRKKRSSGSSQSGSSQNQRTQETSSDERKRRSHKTKRAPPIPNTAQSRAQKHIEEFEQTFNINNSYRNHNNKVLGSITSRSCDKLCKNQTSTSSSIVRNETNGDIFTRVAIPRSGSFLNTGGLTRYKSRAARRNSEKLGGGGGGGSPLGFSELFNEFRLHENLNSLDEILSAIIDADGMSFNSLKPIYKEFLLKLAVTLTKDELFQRSKNIMRRQKKKKTKRKQTTGSEKKPKTLIFGNKSLKKVFQLGQFRSCRGKPPKPPRNKENCITKKDITGPITKATITSGPTNQQRSRVATSGSDVSVIRNENAFIGINRNSSSGYVSCSECSYDSETCTCTSADRCYCSLRTDHANHKMRRKIEEKHARNAKKESRSKKETQSYSVSASGNSNRKSLVSCKSDEKCYCSMGQANSQLPTEDDSQNTVSDTTYCDTDSCISVSKCYCKRTERRNKALAVANPKEKLALDYELFTIGGNGKSVQPDEALSMKKSVEAAAIFADVKLSQTTDIKSLYGAAMQTMENCCSAYSAKRQLHAYSKRELVNVALKNERNDKLTIRSNSSQRSSSADDLLSKLTAMEKAVEYASCAKNNVNRRNEQFIINKYGLRENYQSMRAVSASLEDTLGYLP